MTATKKLSLILATKKDLKLLINLGQFYEYEMSKECKWPWEGIDGGYPSRYLKDNFKRYFTENKHYPYLIYIGKEIAGFVFINNETFLKNNDWNMGEFFILGKFQGQGIGTQVAKQIWKKYKGRWEVSVLYANKKALLFWRKIIRASRKDFEQKTYTTENGKIVILSFMCKKSNQKPPLKH